MALEQTKNHSIQAFRRQSIALWLLIVGAYLIFFILDLRLDYAQLLVPCSGEECNYLAISQAEIDVLERWGLSSQTYAQIMLAATILGVSASCLLSGIILWRQGDTRIGWTVSLILALIPMSMISDADNVVAHYPDLRIPTMILSSIGTLIILGFLYLFPSGRFYPRWAYLPFIISLILFELFSTIYNQILLTPQWFEQLGPALLLGVVVLAGYFQILRYQRESNATERQQTKWLLLGIMLLILGFPVWFMFFGGLVMIQPGVPRLFASLGGWLTNMLFIISLPVTMTIAISRYRLWELDLVIRRTLQYALLTMLLALVYFGSVLLLQNLFENLTGRQSPIVIVLSTLAIAALFNPLRSRIQSFIDRRFYRNKYDAEQTLARFAEVARDEVDIDKLTNALLNVVEETIQPEGISLWLKLPAKK